MKHISAFLITVLLFAGCQGPHSSASDASASGTDTASEVQMPAIVFLTRDGCVNTPVMRERLDASISMLDGEAHYSVLNQANLPATDPRTGYATPTILVNNRDLYGLPTPKMPFAAPS